MKSKQTLRFDGKSGKSQLKEFCAIVWMKKSWKYCCFALLTVDNFDFTEKIWLKNSWKYKMLQFSVVDNFDLTRKIVGKIWLKNSWKCCGFALFICWKLWFDEKNVEKDLDEKIRENIAVLHFNNFVFPRKLKFCQNWIPGVLRLIRSHCDLTEKSNFCNLTNFTRENSWAT